MTPRDTALLMARFLYESGVITSIDQFLDLVARINHFDPNNPQAVYEKKKSDAKDG